MLKNFDKKAEKYDNIESEYLKILYYDLNEGYKDTYKSYSSYRLCTIIEGEKEVSINNNSTFKYNAGEYIILPPNSNVDMIIGANTKAIVYEINSHIIDSISNKVEKVFCPNRTIVKNAYSKDLINIINNLNINMYKNDKEAKFLMDLYAQELVCKLINEENNQLLKNHGIYNPAAIAKDLIMKCGNEEMSIGDVAEILNISQANLHYYFKKEFSISPKKFQNKIKIERANKLLQHNNVTEVASILGFDNISHFIRLYKSVYGITPKQHKP